MKNGLTGTRTLLALILIVSGALLPASPKAEEKDAKPADKLAESTQPAPKEESSVTDHSITIAGQTIPYKATAATILLKNEKDEPTALIYYTGYARSDVKEPSQRPVAFLYNGGPGSSSVWLHMGSFSPKRVVTVNADATPPPRPTGSRTTPVACSTSRTWCSSIRSAPGSVMPLVRPRTRSSGELIRT